MISVKAKLSFGEPSCLWWLMLFVFLVMTDQPKADPHLPDLETSSSIPIQPLYTPDDLHARNPDRDIGYPGDYPYSRGVQATMYRGRLWTMRQYAGMGDAEESNKRYKYLLANGTTGLSVAFDLPTQIGLDSDHALARRRSWKSRCRHHRFHRGHATTLRWYRPDKNLYFDDD